MRILDHPADHRGLAAERVRAHGGEQPFGIGLGADRVELALVGDIERVEAQELAYAQDLVANRHRRFPEPKADPRFVRDLVQGRGEAAPGRIAQRVEVGHGFEHRRDQPVQRRTVGPELGLEPELGALGHDRDAVVAERTGGQDHITRPGAAGADLDLLGHEADAGRGDEQAVALAAFQHPGVAGDDGDPGLEDGASHRAGELCQEVEIEALFEDEGGRQVQRPGAGHGQIVGRAVDGERADVAAREDQGGDHEGVGRHPDPPGRQRQDRLIVASVEPGIGESGAEELLDALARRPPAGAVHHLDPPAHAAASAGACPRSCLAGCRCRP